MGNSNCDLEINVMMVGGRRCGKTSVLASMQRCFEATLRNTSLIIKCANDEMLETIEEKQQEMKQYFVESRFFVPNENETSDWSSYPFNVRIKGKESRIRINFVDYPGEWLTGKKDEVRKNLRESRILLVAIDTPHLVEEYGLYNNPHNRCSIVSELIEDVEFAETDEPGLILFVPLKCERYYNKGEMDEVNRKVQQAYKKTIDYIRKPSADGRKGNITMAITPILTLGEGVEFSRFERDDKGKVKVNERYGTPTKALYKFTDIGKKSKEPDPKYCEQPLFYVLLYVLAQAKMAKEAKKKKDALSFLIDLFQTKILNWSSADDYLLQEDAILKELKKDGDGYSILDKGILKL